MDSEKFKKIDSIYERLLDLPVREHEAYLDEACGDDTELREEIESLLEFDKTTDSFIDSTPDFLAAEMFFSEKEDMSGERLGHYRILSLLGRGGMGAVYLAKDTSLDRRIAIKFLRREFSSDSDKLKRFIQEAKSASALNHPNIITVYEIGNKNGINYIATEFIEGKTLRELIARKKSPPLREILRIAVQIAEALSQAHRAGIIHRDIKPENVMLRPDGYVKVLDFGLAKLFETDAAGGEPRDFTQAHSTPGLIKGTVAYMSPEQARGLKVDKRTDIWSFGVLLYEVLTGETPFAGETLTDILVSIINKEPPDLNFRRPELPAKLSDLIGKTLEKNPAERIRDFEVIINELKFIRRNLESGKNPLSASGDPSAKLFSDEETIIFDSSAAEEQEISSGNFAANNLSSEINPLIGRVSEITGIAGLLQKPNTRLITLTGIGGTGKTRLARAVAASLLKKFRDGIYFIDLSTIEEAELVIPFIAKTFQLEPKGEESISSVLKNFLKAKETLLILDNFEQITRAAPAIGNLIAETKNLKILVTSRVRLHLSFEKEVMIEPLGVPSDNDLEAAELGEYPAVNLFVERARAIKPNFIFSEKNAREIAEICRRLDGLPLAIELAAARIKLLAPQAILKRLDKSLKLLTGGAKDLPERQQTMRQTIAWSYDLLEADEKKLLNRISVFRGGFDIEAAEAVGIFDEDFDILDALTSLVDKSLIVQKEQADGEPRFRLLVVVREFTREKLLETDELDKARKRHAEFFRRLAEEAEPEFETGSDKEWLDKIESEIDNFRAALEWTADNAPETSLQIAGSLGSFWIRRGYFSEGERRLRHSLERVGQNADKEITAKSYIHLGNLSWRLGNHDRADRFCEKGLQISREIGDKILIVRALEAIGQVKMVRNEPSAAREFFREGYRIVKELDSKYDIANLANNLGNLSNLEKNIKASDTYYEESLKISREISYGRMIQIACVNLAGNKLRAEDFQSARSYAVESLEIAVEADDRIGIAYTFEIFLALAAVAGEFEKAVHIGEVMYGIYEDANYEIEFYEKEQIESYLKKARAGLGEDQLKKAETSGRKLSVEDAVRLALNKD